MASTQKEKEQSGARAIRGVDEQKIAIWLGPALPELIAIGKGLDDLKMDAQVVAKRRQMIRLRRAGIDFIQARGPENVTDLFRFEIGDRASDVFRARFVVVAKSVEINGIAQAERKVGARPRCLEEEFSGLQALADGREL